MVCSTTGRIVVVIGDQISNAYGQDLVELSGDSINSLKWTKLQQSLLPAEVLEILLHALSKKGSYSKLLQHQFKMGTKY